MLLQVQRMVHRINILTTGIAMRMHVTLRSVRVFAWVTPLVTTNVYNITFINSKITNL